MKTSAARMGSEGSCSLGMKRGSSAKMDLDIVTDGGPRGEEKESPDACVEREKTRRRRWGGWC